MGKISGTLWLIFEFPLNINIWRSNKSRTLFENLSSVVHSLKTRVWRDADGKDIHWEIEVRLL